MSLVEWLFEPSNPGPVGKVDAHHEDPDDSGKPPKKWLIYVIAFAGLLLAGIGFYWVLSNRLHNGVGTVIIRVCWFILYVMISHFIAAKPETSNMGWAGGLIDNPFRISDDYNRLLLIFQVLLLPGKIIAFGLIIGWLLCRRFFQTLSSFSATFRRNA
ncbi:hypothetical protein IQ277_31700 [Nostocales cyanobacterium LEGE 12452]|nr:hypothetical protein [Nostocales cyanobacterium LEGE 12452]